MVACVGTVDDVMMIDDEKANEVRRVQSWNMEQRGGPLRSCGLLRNRDLLLLLGAGIAVSFRGSFGQVTTANAASVKT